MVLNFWTPPHTPKPAPTALGSLSPQPPPDFVEASKILCILQFFVSRWREKSQQKMFSYNFFFCKSFVSSGSKSFIFIFHWCQQRFFSIRFDDVIQSKAIKVEKNFNSFVNFRDFDRMSRLAYCGVLHGYIKEYYFPNQTLPNSNQSVTRAFPIKPNNHYYCRIWRI